MANVDMGTDAGLTYQGKPRTSGLRFSATDAVAIVACGIGTWLLWPTLGILAVLLPYTLAHFFLFCNVFRIRRPPELIWAGVFVANVTICLAAFQWPLAIPMLAQLLVTLLLIVRETRRPSYHGIFARQWNADHLDAYLRGDVE